MFVKNVFQMLKWPTGFDSFAWAVYNTTTTIVIHDNNNTRKLGENSDVKLEHILSHTLEVWKMAFLSRITLMGVVFGFIF